MFIEFKPGQKYPGKNAEISDSMNGFTDAGYVIEDNDLIIDIDCLDKSKIEKLMTVFNIKTHTVWTDRGCHLYFKKGIGFTKGANKVCSLGFPIELKHTGNTKAITVKRNGVEREVENRGIREDMPMIFSLNKKFDSLLGMDEAEGRNNALFKLRNQLASCEGWQKILRFINEYIFASPLDENEMETLTRDMTPSERQELDEFGVAGIVTRKYKPVMFGGSLYFKENDRYVKARANDMDNNLIYKRIEDISGPRKTYFAEEVIKRIQRIEAKPVPKDSIFDIRFKNGILKDGEFIEIETEEFTPYYIPYDYIPNAERVEEVDQFFKDTTGDDKNFESFLYEIIGHTLITDWQVKKNSGLSKIFFIQGPGGTGKSTYKNIIDQILGEFARTNMPGKLKKENYLYSLLGTLANIGDDIPASPLDDDTMEVIKKIATGDAQEVRNLYEETQKARLIPTLIFTSNHFNKSFEKEGGYKRRVVWLPFHTKVKKKNNDLEKIILSEKGITYILSKVVEAYKRLYINREFTECKTIIDFTTKYHDNNNHVLEFISNEVEKDDVIGLKIGDIYEQDYLNWVRGASHEEVSKKLFSQTFTEELGLVMKNGHSKELGRTVYGLFEK